jgi:hypothetical protein
MSQVKILHAPLHGPSFVPAVGRRAYTTGAHSIGWSEAYKALPWLRKNPGRYRHFTADGTRKDARGRRVGWDVVISIRRDCAVQANGSFLLSPELNVGSTGIKYHPERHAVWVVFTTPAGIRVLDLRWHPQPGALRRPKVLGEYRKSVALVERRLNALVSQYKPDLVVVGGDLQLGASGRWIGPSRLYRRLGMEGQRRGVDWLGWTATFRAVKGWQIPIRRVARGMDHPWLVRVLARR